MMSVNFFSKVQKKRCVCIDVSVYMCDEAHIAKDGRYMDALNYYFTFDVY